ncbi:hypothetical protein D3C80_1054760 [compost metagenome]
MATPGLAQGVINVKTEIATFAIAVDQGREDLVRQRRRHELWVLPQTLDQRRADFLGQWMAFWKLQVVLGLGRLITRSDLAVSPLGPLQRLTDTRDFLGGEQSGNV